MTAIIKEEILPFSVDILRVLNGCRFDKIKPVREATLETIKLIREINQEHGGVALLEEENVREPEIIRDRSTGARSARPSKQATSNFKSDNYQL
jgi:hypothetical protein